MANHPDKARVLTYRNTDDGDRTVNVYEGSGAHDAMRTDPGWERVEGADPEPRVASKVGDGPIDGLSTPELRQLAAQAGHPAPGDLSRSEALAVAEAREANLQAQGNRPNPLAQGDPGGPGAEGEPDAKGGDSDAGDDGGEDDLDDLTRDQLDRLARKEGVDDPDKLANKGEVVDAIRAARG